MTNIMSVRSAVVVGVLQLLVIAHTRWIRQIQSTVPKPYLDEVFHVPQADAYWQGRWSHWDDKITTPPGVYLWSILVSKVIWYDPHQTTHLSSYQLRYTNFLLPYLLMMCAFTLQPPSAATTTRWHRDACREVAMFAFPLIFFFSGLYYTDVFSALAVMSSFAFWQAASTRRRGFTKAILQMCHLLSGLFSLACRQTNIFWVAVFTGGLQAVITIKQNATVHDPPIAEAQFEDYFTMLWSLATSIFGAIPNLLLDLWPHFSLLASFAAFVVWNGGVVLGDKSNHVATIHLPQMLYIWPFIMFFSWPVLLPHLARPQQLLHRIPRAWLIILGVATMTAIVHFNTIVHEFLLADNRHYTFYVFKILRTRPWLWYAAVPVYSICAWLSLVALGGMSATAGNKQAGQIQQGRQPASSTVTKTLNSGNHLSFLLIWILSTALSLVTAPLVEPRYFIVPWLMWRFHIPDDTEEAANGSTRTGDRRTMKNVKRWTLMVARNSFWVELAWYMLINLVTCRLFLKHEFRWPQSPNETQRFMW